jgi:hypothetical protein
MSERALLVDLFDARARAAAGIARHPWRGGVDVTQLSGRN